MSKNISPLRYPGGKVKLFNLMANMIDKNFSSPPMYIEPFAGGAGLALLLLSQGKVSKVIINDFDKAIYSFWYCVKFHKKEIVDKINNTTISISEWEKQREIYNNLDNYTILEVGFATFFLNRTNRSGIIKAGPIGGKTQKGKYKIDCRFNKNRLVDRIEQIFLLANKIEIFNLDAEEFINKIAKKYKNEVFIYIDPPYVEKGPELYKNFYNENSHIELSETILTVLKKHSWVITYDNVELIRGLYSNNCIKEYNLNYSAGKNKVGNEIIIFSNNIKNIDISMLKND